MKNKIRRFIGEKYTLLKARWKKEKVQDLSNFFSDSKKVLLLLPMDENARDLSIPVIELLKERFGSRALTIIVIGEGVRNISQINGARFIKIAGKDLGFMYLPKKEVLRRISKNQYDLVLDLNIPFEHSAAYICRQTVSKYRVSFAKKYADLFYNIQFRSLLGQSVQRTYQSLIDFLQKF